MKFKIGDLVKHKYYNKIFKITDVNPHHKEQFYYNYNIVSIDPFDIVHNGQYHENPLGLLVAAGAPEMLGSAKFKVGERVSFSKIPGSSFRIHSISPGFTAWFYGIHCLDSKKSFLTREYCLTLEEELTPWEWFDNKKQQA